jgi:hypothetical protein
MFSHAVPHFLSSIKNDSDCCQLSRSKLAALAFWTTDLTLHLLGFLGGKTWFGRTIVLIQYWRSFEDLEAYAKAKDHEHLPAWADFNRKVGNDGTVGIYHETYRIQPGCYENVFVNMPPTLLGDCSTLIEAKGRLAAAAGRMGGLAADRI